jgi:competence protein ComEC
LLGFGGASITGIITNLFAVPLLSAVLMPLLLASLLLVPATLVEVSLCADIAFTILNWFLVLTDWCLALLLNVIWWVPVVWWVPLHPLLPISAAVFGLSYRLSTPFLAMLWLCCLLSRSTDDKTLITVTAFDVGHGLAMAVVTDDIIVLYDTGNAWQKGSYADSIIIPFVYTHHRDKPVWLIVSHDDADHSAGAEQIIEEIKLDRVLSPSVMVGRSPCVEGINKRIGSTNIDVVWPTMTKVRAYNPDSCVVRISVGKQSILLTGDIDKLAEYLLMQRSTPTQLESDILSVPHHGSESSSTEKLLRWVKPTWSVAGTDFNGRWGLPKASIKQRYQNHGSHWRDTGTCGAITLRGTQVGEHMLWESSSQRDHQAWYRGLLRNQSVQSVASCYRQLSQ